MPGERRPLTDIMRSQRRGEPIAQSASCYDGGFGRPATRGLCGQRRGAAGETLQVYKDMRRDQLAPFIYELRETNATALFRFEELRTAATAWLSHDEASGRLAE